MAQAMHLRTHERARQAPAIDSLTNERMTNERKIEEADECRTQTEYDPTKGRDDEEGHFRGQFKADEEGQFRDSAS